MQVPFLSLQGQHKTVKDEFFLKLNELYDNTEFAYGKTSIEFEDKFAQYNQVKFASALDNGTTAVEVCLRAANIGHGDEVITVSNTFIATVAAIHFTGATPVFVEVDANTWNIDSKRVEEKITPKTKAIIAVNLYGQPADLISLQEIAKKHKIILIADAAQSIGATIFHNNIWKSASVFADMTTYSFYAGKNLGACGEAGAVVSNNKAYIDFINMFRDHGSKIKYIHEIVGRNHRIDAFQSAALLTKLNYIDSWNKQRQQIAEWYFDLLKDVEEIQLPTILSGVTSVFHLFVVLVNNRQQFQDFLASKGVGTAFHYKKPVHLQDAFKYLGISSGSLPITESVVERNISLPMFPELTFEQIKYVAETIKEHFVKETKNR